VTDVDPELFYDAAAVYSQNSDAAAATLGKIAGAGVSGAAGTHGVGPEWGKAFDTAADEAGQVTSRLVNVFHNLGSLLRQDGVNHDETEQASTLNQRDAYGAPITPPGVTAGTYLDNAVNVGSVSGGGDPEPPHWDLVGDKIVDGWPDGHPDHALAAAAAWKDLGKGLVQIDGQASPQEQRLLGETEAEEVPAASARLGETRTVSINVSGACGDLSSAAEDYGNQLKAAKSAIAESVRDLYAMVSALESWPPPLSEIAEGFKLLYTSIAAHEINGYNAALRVTATESMTNNLTPAATAMGTSLPLVKTLLTLVPRRVNPTPTQRVNDNRRKGSRAEQIAGINQSAKKTIDVIDETTGAKRTRIPDEIDGDNHVVREVKNVQNLYATQQLRDMAQWARDNHFKLVIVVDKGRTVYGNTLDRLRELYPGLDVSIDKSMNLS
jgi:uncharacterized protein YukE